MTKLFQSMLLGLSLAVLFAGSAQAKDEAKPSASASASASAASAKAKAAPLMDINTASKKELASLPKIGDARSDAIIKGRPYKAKDELVDKKILTEDVYKEIKDLIIAKQPAKADQKKK